MLGEKLRIKDAATALKDTEGGGKKISQLQFLLGVLAPLRRQNVLSFIPKQEAEQLSEREKTEVCLREKNEALAEMLSEAWWKLPDSVRKGTYRQEWSKYKSTVLAPHYIQLFNRFFVVDDKHQIAARDRLAGGKGQYLAFFRELAKVTTDVIDGDEVAGRRPIPTVGQLDDIYFRNKPLDDDGNLRNSYLADTFNSLLILRRDEFLALMTEVMGRDADDPMVKWIESRVYGKKSTGLLKRFRQGREDEYSKKKRRLLGDADPDFELDDDGELADPDSSRAAEIDDQIRQAMEGESKSDHSTTSTNS